MAGDTQAVQRYQASPERTAVLGGIQHKRKLYSQLDNFVEQDVVTDEEDEFCTCAMKIKRQVIFSTSNFPYLITDSFSTTNWEIPLMIMPQIENTHAKCVFIMSLYIQPPLNLFVGIHSM